MDDHIIKTFGNKMRVRACGILVKDDSVLLVKHSGIGEKEGIWMPPGGGVDFGVSIKNNLIREFLEETGLEIIVLDLISTNEFLNPPLHAIELFFKVQLIGGKLVVGNDPELPEDKQIIKEVRFVTFKELTLIPNKQKHRLLHNINKVSDLNKINLYIDNI